MRLQRQTLIGLVSILLGIACSRPVEDVPTTQEDMIAVARLMVTLDRVISEEDLEGLLTLVSEDAVYMLPDRSAIVGKRAIGDFYRTLFAETDIEIVHEVLEIDVAGDLIIHRGNATGSMAPLDGDAAIEFDDKYLFVIKRSMDGSLYVWRAMMNRNSGTAASEPQP